MIHMVNTKQKMKSKKMNVKQRLLVATATTVLCGSFIISPLVRADQFDDQVQQLQAQNSQNQASVKELAVKADSYQGEISRLQGEIDAVRGQIRLNEVKRDEIQSKIKIAEEELEKQKVLLGQNIKAIYVEGQTSTVVMLASSKDLSEFLDKQQYRETIQQKIKDTLDKINALKAQLKEQKSQIEQLLSDQQHMNEQLGTSQAEQSRLLAFTEEQKNQYTAQIRSNNSAIANLRAQQAALYAAYARRNGVRSYGVGEAGNGGYPSVWASAAQDTLVDDWGLYNRECVSYVAWKITNNGGHVPYGLGNAADWVWRAERNQIPTGSTPKVGSAIVWESGDGLGQLGHVAYVEAVNGDGSVEVSQYNVVHGQFSRMRVPAYDVAHLSFIYFN